MISMNDDVMDEGTDQDSQVQGIPCVGVRDAGMDGHGDRMTMFEEDLGQQLFRVFAGLDVGVGYEESLGALLR